MEFFCFTGPTVRHAGTVAGTLIFQNIFQVLHTVAYNIRMITAMLQNVLGIQGGAKKNNALIFKAYNDKMKCATGNPASNELYHAPVGSNVVHL
ncbi:hypothetical protein L596_026202 [Steinernema carpocapsae]|uniref:Uncharacterized protein n=1 Tax=Steinernema carpocapsae TaxID=34508 RepID=A0A4U5M1N1_STECR|nr:hypothetical protein L596_026202 [Steinernema carpocapsae]